MTARILLVSAALALRIAIALATRHVGFDLQVMFAMRRALLDHGFAAYPHVRNWVYPPGFMPWLLGGVWIGDHLGLPRDFVVRAPSMLADAVLALVVMAGLERSGASRRSVLGAGALIAFGPMYVVVSAYNGQIDALAILPAVIALLVWERSESPSRAVVCGLLIGVGAAVKTVPILLALALLPTARSTKERAWLVGAAIAVPALASLPFFLARPAATSRVLLYAGIPGLGGWSVIALPYMTRAWFHLEPFRIIPLMTALYFAALGLLALVLVAILLFRQRSAPRRASCSIWLTVFACSLSVFPQYTTWVFPFLLLAGRIREVATLSAILLPIAWILYADLPSAAVHLFRVLALALHLSFVAMWCRDFAHLWRSFSLSRDGDRLAPKHR
jgi:glycosyl transferase family 87